MLSKNKYSSCLALFSLSLSLGLMLVPQSATEARNSIGAVAPQARVDGVGRLKFDTDEDRAPQTSMGGASRFADDLNFIPPEEDNSPESSNGGASRGTQSDVCPQDRNRELSGPSLTAVLPASDQGLTVSGHPTFLVYVPQTSAGQARFIIQDDNNPDLVTEIYETTFDLPKSLTETGGLVPIEMPKNQAELEMGKTYTYYATLICSPGDGGGINYDRGFVTRIEMPDNIALVEQNSELSPEQALWQQTMLYAESGIWLDTVNSLVALMEYEPNNKDLENQWMSLMRSDFVNLDEAIAKARIVDLSNQQ
jgi:hypothetical protein